MDRTESEAAEFKPGDVGLCLDFINTVSGRPSDHPKDALPGYAELVTWSHRANQLTQASAGHLLAAAAQRPAEAAATHATATSFREALYRLLRAALAGNAPDADDLAIFNAARAQALLHSQIAPAATGFLWRWVVDKQELGWPLWPVALSAAELLLSPDLKQVKLCLAPDCGWLFLDTTKNHTRRWCSMQGCGNRAKGRRHYQRKRQSARS